MFMNSITLRSSNILIKFSLILCLLIFLSAAGNSISILFVLLAFFFSFFLQKKVPLSLLLTSVILLFSHILSYLFNGEFVWSIFVLISVILYLFITPFDFFTSRSFVHLLLFSISVYFLYFSSLYLFYSFDADEVLPGSRNHLVTYLAPFLIFCLFNLKYNVRLPKLHRFLLSVSVILLILFLGYNTGRVGAIFSFICFFLFLSLFRFSFVAFFVSIPLFAYFLVDFGDFGGFSELSTDGLNEPFREAIYFHFFSEIFFNKPFGIPSYYWVENFSVTSHSSFIQMHSAFSILGSMFFLFFLIYFFISLMHSRNFFLLFLIFLMTTRFFLDAVLYSPVFMFSYLFLFRLVFILKGSGLHGKTSRSR